MTPEERGKRVGRALYPADERACGYVAGLVAGEVREAVAAVTNPEPADAVRAERWRLATAIRGGPTGGPCACAGCKHAANCRCGCPECVAESAVAAERERIAVQVHELLYGEVSTPCRKRLVDAIRGPS